ncbi:hypothetical protein AC1031_010215 [Aphanomyces cochlioides]|nr:hypothetical protein AC1031_010215 [Aphanomyces cochlioides]
MATKVYTKEEVAQHKTEKDCWVIIGRPGAKKVYDFTPFLNQHPGGPELVLTMAGQDVNEMFEDIGHTTDALKQMDKLCIGKLVETPTPVVKKFEKPHQVAGDYAFLLVLFLVVVSTVYSHLDQAGLASSH